MKKQVLSVGMILVLLALSLSGCTDSINEAINPPKVSITGQTSREGFEGANKVGYVDITVKNNGGSGSATVYVKVTQGNDQWTKDQSIQIGAGETRSFTFTFREIKFWTLDPWQYTAWVE